MKFSMLFSQILWSSNENLFQSCYAKKKDSIEYTSCYCLILLVSLFLWDKALNGYEGT